MNKKYLSKLIFIVILLTTSVAGLLIYKLIITNKFINSNINIETNVLPLKQVASSSNVESGATYPQLEWQTYRNEEYGFEVKLPIDSVMQKNTGETYISFLGKLEEKDYFLHFDYISQNALNTSGINYCQVHLNDSRCENFNLNNLHFLIDWNIETEGAFTQSRAEVLKPGGGIVVISVLHSPNQDLKSFFRQILSTLIFI